MKNKTTRLAIIGLIIGFLMVFGQTEGKLQIKDDSFVPEANNDVYSTAIQPDGKILIGARLLRLTVTPESVSPD